MSILIFTQGMMFDFFHALLGFRHMENSSYLIKFSFKGPSSSRGQALKYLNLLYSKLVLRGSPNLLTKSQGLSVVGKGGNPPWRPRTGTRESNPETNKQHNLIQVQNGQFKEII